jgi:hypothetical protein
MFYPCILLYISTYLLLPISQFLIISFFCRLKINHMMRLQTLAFILELGVAMNNDLKRNSLGSPIRCKNQFSLLSQIYRSYLIFLLFSHMICKTCLQACTFICKHANFHALMKVYMKDGMLTACILYLIYSGVSFKFKNHLLNVKLPDYDWTSNC